MELLKEYILQKGRVLPGEIIQVDGFLNHCIDTKLVDAIGTEFFQEYREAKPTIILTIEASGIAVAYATAQQLEIPVLFAKKGEAKNIGANVYAADVYSYTRDKTYGVYVSKKFLSLNDRVLIVDDILANAQAAMGLLSICEQAGAEVVGIGIVIEKKWQRGSELLRKRGLPLKSLAVVEAIEDGEIRFEETIE